MHFVRLRKDFCSSDGFKLSVLFQVHLSTTHDGSKVKVPQKQSALYKEVKITRVCSSKSHKIFLEKGKCKKYYQILYTLLPYIYIRTRVE